MRIGRARRKHDPSAPTLVSVDHTIDIAAPAAQVWGYVRSPQSAVDTLDEVKSGFVLPESPVGRVGEQHCYLVRMGNETIETVLEVVELGEWHVVMSQVVEDSQIRVTTTIESVEVHARMRLRMEGTYPREEASEVRARWSTVIQTQLDGVRRRMERPHLT
jgi:hypothetical protein